MTFHSLTLNPIKSMSGGGKRRKLSHNSSFQFELESELETDLGVSLLEDEENEENEESHCRGALDFSRAMTLRKEPLGLLGPTPPTTASSDHPPQTPNKSRRRNHDKNNVDQLTSFSLKCRPRQKHSADRFARVSNEVVLEIFRWLPKVVLKNCAQVCKRFKHLVYDESLWRRVDLGGGNYGPDMMGHVLRRGVTILRLSKTDIATPLGIASSKFNNGSSRYCKLQVLDLSMSTLCVAGLNEMLSVCNKLKFLSLEHCLVDDETCSYISRNTEMSELNLAMCSGLTCEGMRAILSNCTRLSSLNLSWTELPKQCVATVVNNMPSKMVKLNLSGCRNTLEDKFVEKLVSRCPNLKELDLSDAVELTQKSLKAVVSRLPDITALALSRCYNINPECYELLQHTPSLADFTVFGLFNQTGIDFLKNKFPNLTVNGSHYSTMARPTTGLRRTSIWGFRLHK